MAQFDRGILDDAWTVKIELKQPNEALLDKLGCGSDEHIGNIAYVGWSDA